MPTAMTELSESSMDVVDVVTCAETGLALTDSDVATVETVTENTHTPIDIYETTVKGTHTLPTLAPTVSSLFTIPTTMKSGNIPKVLCRILGCTFPIMLDTGAH